MKKLLAAISLVFIPAVSFAHGTGIFLDKTVGDYYVDVGAMPTTGLANGVNAKDNIYFEFKLFTADKNSSVPFTDLKVVLTRADQEVLNKTLTLNGTFYMNYVFQDSGDYILKLTYIKSGKELLTTDLPIPVGQVVSKTKKIFIYILEGLPVIIGWPMVMYYGYKEYRRRKLEKKKQP